MESLKSLFDFNGRLIPHGITDKICDADKDYYLISLGEIDYSHRLNCLAFFLKNVRIQISEAGFREGVEKLVDKIKCDPQISNILKSVYLPVLIPRLTRFDLGDQLEYFLTGVATSIAKSFTNKRLYNFHNDLPYKVRIIGQSRHQQLIQKMRQGPVIGIYFPNSMQGFSIIAQREHMSILPKGFILSGIDTAIAITMYPDILARDSRTPWLQLSALSYRSPGSSLIFQPENDSMFFQSIGIASDNNTASGGLLYIG